MSLRTFSVQPPRSLGEVLRHEANPLYSRRTVDLTTTAAEAVDLDVGTVLGRRLFGTPVAGAAGGNTGTGSITAVALAAAVMAGVYTLTAASDTLFTVFDPLGRRLADLTVGQAWQAGGLAVTVTAGGTAFAAGDALTVTVPAGDRKLLPLDPAAHDGTGTAAAVTTMPLRIEAGETVRAAVLIGGGAVALYRGGLVWPDGTTPEQTAAGLTALEAAGFLIVT